MAVRCPIVFWGQGAKAPATTSHWDGSLTWWRHEMKTFSASLAICAGNSPVPGEFPTQRPVTQSFDVFFDLRLNKRLSKQWWGWWFGTLSRPLWRHRNDHSKCLRNPSALVTPVFCRFSWHFEAVGIYQQYVGQSYSISRQDPWHPIVFPMFVCGFE